MFLYDETIYDIYYVFAPNAVDSLICIQNWHL